MRVDPEAVLEHLDASGLSRYDMPEFILPLSEMRRSVMSATMKGCEIVLSKPICSGVSW